MKNVPLIILFVLLIPAASINIIAQSWLYLGQSPPGMTPQRFPPGSLLANENWFWHGSPSFSPDGREMYWAKYTIHPSYQRIELAFVEVVNSQWTGIQIPSFANLNYGENNPYFSEGGDTLYFLSERPGGFIFFVTRTPSGWSQPIPLDIPLPANSVTGWQFTVTKNKTIYFEIWANNGSDPPDIYKTTYMNGQYSFPQNIGLPVNTNYNEFDPYIDPNERFIIFTSDRPGGHGYHDIYISSRNPDGSWNEPVNLGPDINSESDDAAPYISPDGLYFFFNAWKTNDLGYNPYWVDAQVIYNLITGMEDERDSNAPLTFQLYQNYPNPFNPSTTIKYDIPTSENVTLKIYDVMEREIKTLVNAFQPVGLQSVTWDGKDNSGEEVSSGIYYYQVKVGNQVQIKKMTLIK